MKATSVLCACFLLAGCAGLLGGETREGVSSSLVDYLYPDGEKPPEAPDTIPHLQLPLRVGIAFVPASSGPSALSEADRVALLEKVKAHFAGRDFISELAVIPETYMRSGNGFQTLEQVARLYDLDVMALVSYDQVAHIDERTSSFLYWTIVGAYVVKGNENDVNTFVDTAVFDIPTRRLLFRAPGVSDMNSSTTLVGLESDLRATQQKGFDAAMSDMTVNLDKELDSFKQRILTEGTVRVTRADGSSYGSGGGGAGDFAWIAALLLLVRVACRSR